MSAEDFIHSNIDQFTALINSQINKNFIDNCPPGVATFASLLSESAKPFLEEMALRAQTITWQRFGRVIRLYAPIYISNECANGCTYCGFRASHKFKRSTLNQQEIAQEFQILHDKGIRHILIVAGESPRAVNAEKIAQIAKDFHQQIPSLSIEIAPMSTDDYQTMVNAGIEGLAVYQETYDRERYSQVHLSGKKQNYSWRLATAERGAEAGMRHISLGALLGLSNDFKKDSIALALHLTYLLKHHWKTNYSVSLPRLCECEGGFKPACTVTDRDLAQLIFAYRIAFPDVGINLSTRESELFRDSLAGVGVTHMSSESTTEPGGYAKQSEELEGKQFLPHDTRKTHEFCQMLINKGLEPVWKDWDSSII
ncbi:MAG: 2-iminoacetate synthase ThiH [Lentisphaeria bacterium]